MPKKGCEEEIFYLENESEDPLIGFLMKGILGGVLFDHALGQLVRFSVSFLFELSLVLWMIFLGQPFFIDCIVVGPSSEVLFIY